MGLCPSSSSTSFLFELVICRAVSQTFFLIPHCLWSVFAHFKIHFPQGATSLADGSTCALWWVCWRHLCLAWGNPILFHRGHPCSHRLPTPGHLHPVQYPCHFPPYDLPLGLEVVQLYFVLRWENWKVLVPAVDITLRNSLCQVPSATGNLVVFAERWFLWMKSCRKRWASQWQCREGA